MQLVRCILACAMSISIPGAGRAQEATRTQEIAYKPNAQSEYERSRCSMDVYLPPGKKEFATLVWFHGGGLENGDKRDTIAMAVVGRMVQAGVAVVSVNYRLSPEAKYPSYVDDAAAAVAHTLQVVPKMGGDPRRVFVSGHSAGAYLSAMLAVAPQFLDRYSVKPSELAGFLPVSGQMITHSTVRKERGLSKTQPVIDEAAPAWYVGPDVPPMLCIWGDEDLPTRAEENAYFVAAMKAAGNQRIEGLHVAARTHETIASLIGLPNDIVAERMLKFIADNQAPRVASDVILRVEQDERAISVYRGDAPVLVYNIQSPPAPEGIDQVYERSGFMHPVYSPGGQVLTAAFPVDHAHQHGIFAAWVKTKFRGQAVDFWNLAGRTGRVVHERVVAVDRGQDGSVSFEVDLLHRALLETPVDVLRERWRVTVRPTDGAYNCFDLETTQQALTDDPLIVEKYHYGGVAYRGPVAWVLASDGDKRRGPSASEENEMLNSLGMQRVDGNHAHAHWVAISGMLGGKSASLAVFDHPRNFRAPQAARLHPTKPYFVYSPCVDGEFQIDREHPYRAQYRFIVSDRPARPRQLEQLWQQWEK